MHVNERYLRAAAFFITLLGAVVLGITTGMGIVAYMVQQRLACGTDFVVKMGVCEDIVSPVMDMMLASGVGGFLAFVSGLAGIGLTNTSDDE